MEDQNLWWVPKCFTIQKSCLLTHLAWFAFGGVRPKCFLAVCFSCFSLDLWLPSNCSDASKSAVTRVSLHSRLHKQTQWRPWASSDQQLPNKMGFMSTNTQWCAPTVCRSISSACLIISFAVFPIWVVFKVNSLWRLVALSDWNGFQSKTRLKVNE